MIRIARVFMLLLLALPVAVFAQGDDIPPLTETYTVVAHNLDFQAPAGWEPPFGDGAEGGNGKVFLFSAPIGGTGVPNAEGFSVEGGATVVFLTFEANGDSAEAKALAAAEEFATEDSTFELGDPQALDINGRVGSQVDVTSMFFINRYIGMEVEGGVVVTVEILGFEEGVTRTTPIVMAMLATVRESGTPIPENVTVAGPPLPQSHLREADQTRFNYPADWGLQEQENFTLLIVPNGVTVGISSDYLPGLDDVVDDTITFKRERLSAGIPGTTLGEPEAFEVNGQRAASVFGLDGETYYGFWSIDLGGNVVGNISIIGDRRGVVEIESTIFAIAETITSGQVAEGAVSAGDAIALTETATSDDGTLSVQHPDGWEVQSLDDAIILFGGPDAASGGGELFIMVQSSLDFLAENIGLDLPDDVDATIAAREISVNAEANGAQLTVEKVEINERAASVLYGTDGDAGSVIVLFELEDGSVAALMAGLPDSAYEDLRPLLLAIAKSVRSE